MAATYNMHEAKTHLSRLAERAAGGEEIVTARNGRPLARLGPLTAPPKRRELGFWKSEVLMSDDFDAPLAPELQRHFEGDGD